MTEEDRQKSSIFLLMPHLNENEVLYGPDKVVEIFYQCFVTL